MERLSDQEYKASINVFERSVKRYRTMHLSAKDRTDELKWGTHVGTDKYGNKYYQNKMYFMGRSRWVHYSDEKYGWDYDGSQVPAEWHRWLHYIGDEVPTKENTVDYKWMVDHKPNMTGTNEKYMPYSTTRPKIEAWKPPQ